jgi:serine/threonine protein kinase
MLKRRIQDLTVCFTYNFSCLHPQSKYLWSRNNAICIDRGQKDFRNQYQLCEEIQRGGFGIVYKAYRISDRLPVAVKYVEHKHVREWTMV